MVVVIWKYMEDGVKSDLVLGGENVDSSSRSAFWKENMVLVIILCLIGVAIVGLSTAILVVNIANGRDGQNGIVVELPGPVGEHGEKYAPSMQALRFSNMVEEKLNDDGKYDIGDALKDYENAYAFAEDELKFYLAVQQAWLVYNFYGDANYARKVLEGVKGIAETSYLYSRTYYDTLYQIYSLAGDEEGMAYSEEMYNYVKEHYEDWGNNV